MLGGPKALKALAAPFPGVKFIPTGGITVENIGEYLKMPVVFACGGSWIVAKKLLSEGRYDEVTRLTIEALDIVHSVRGEQ
jgi:2-dehydro-3-deoxyphosphogluconate aldolase/(4S)-4-hydroxy-2-oxoglutarate aldolase